MIEFLILIGKKESERERERAREREREKERELRTLVEASYLLYYIFSTCC